MNKIINTFAKLGCYTLIAILGTLAVLFGITFFNAVTSFLYGMYKALITI